MKKLLSILMAGAIMASGLVGLAACGGSDGADIAEMAEAASKMTTEQLIEKAKAETGKFIAYGNTSRIADAVKNFVNDENYGKKIGLTDATGTKQTDSEIYTLLANESINNDKSSNASMVLIQDSATLAQYRATTSILTNYIPYGISDTVDENNLVPLVHQFLNKLFIYNNTGDTTAKFTNVWQLTEAKYNGNIFFKNPTTEQVNMNFLIMLTSDEWSTKLETAYKSYNNNAGATDVGEGKTYANYGYKWIAEFLNNCNFSYTSDTKMAAGLSKTENAGKLGLFVLAKLRDSSVTSDNLSVSAWDKDASGDYVTIEPFAGFMYSMYAQLATYGARPYTAMLFINYLMTAEGFKPWSTAIGGYSSNTSVPVYSGDSELSFWKQTLVFENGEYISSVKTAVEDFINKKIADK
jgi:iron(III) transport system substrate-binding protein